MGFSTGSNYLDNMFGLDNSPIAQGYYIETENVKEQRLKFEDMGFSLADGERFVDDLTRCLLFAKGPCREDPASALVVLLILYSIPSLETDVEKTAKKADAIEVVNELFPPIEATDGTSSAHPMVIETEKCIKRMESWLTAWLFKPVSMTNEDLISTYISMAKVKSILDLILSIDATAVGTSAVISGASGVLDGKGPSQALINSLKSAGGEFAEGLAKRLGSKTGVLVLVILAAANAALTMAISHLEHEAITRVQAKTMTQEQYALINDSWKDHQKIKPYW